MAEADEAEATISFFPPLYLRRYGAVHDAVRACADKGVELRKLIDVGCAECKFLRRARNLPFLREIYGLDVDRDLLRRSTDNVEPLIGDYLNKNRDDQTLALYCGSIAERDDTLLDCDVITAIEVIEHLPDDVLNDFVVTVFEYANPKLVVLTTPNSEFNVLFPNFSGFRHWDHKFEWTRAQFQHWCDGIADRYDYSVEYSGVGDPPEGRSQLGHCSQMATLTRNQLTRNTSLKPSTKYERIHSVVYEGHHFSDDQLLSFHVNARLTHAFSSYEDGEYLPLADLHSLVGKVDSVEALAAIVERLGFQLSEGRDAVLVDRGGDSSTSDEEPYCEDTPATAEAAASDSQEEAWE